jgi:hypothetical protein
VNADDRQRLCLGRGEVRLAQRATAMCGGTPAVHVDIDEDGPPAETPIQGELAMQRSRWGDIADPAKPLVLPGVLLRRHVNNDGWRMVCQRFATQNWIALRAGAICGIRTATWQPYWPHRVAQPPTFVVTNTRRDRGRALGRVRCALGPPGSAPAAVLDEKRSPLLAAESRSPRSRLGTYRLRRPYDVAGGALVDDR